ncbi:MAG: 2-phospho-L-lactate guanylyltransferase [Actinomycetes bacterium]
MTTFAILPMKSPEVGKSRLYGEIPDAQRRALAAAMFADVLVALGRCSEIETVVVVSSDVDTARMAAHHGAEWLDDGGVEGHSAAASLGVAHAVANGAARVLLVPGDCPALDPVEVDAFLLEHRSPAGLVVIPDRHGTGTNALLLCPPDAITPAFGPGSHQRHLGLAADASVASKTVSISSLSLDIDTAEDLVAMRDHLLGFHGGAAHTRGLLTQMAQVAVD